MLENRVLAEDDLKHNHILLKYAVKRVMRHHDSMLNYKVRRQTRNDILIDLSTSFEKMPLHFKMADAISLIDTKILVQPDLVIV